MNEKEFWESMDKSGECWIWKKAKARKGYGDVWYKGKHWVASRLAWFLTNGPIPEGIEVLHSCDNPPCCRPNHLFLGTKFDNMQDMVQKGRNYQHTHPEKVARGERNGSCTHPEKRPRGEKHGIAKLTEEQVVEIRRRYKPREVTLADLAMEFGVDKSNIGYIIQRKAWKHI